MTSTFNPAVWNPPASAGGGMRCNTREVALLKGASGSCRRGLHFIVNLDKNAGVQSVANVIYTLRQTSTLPPLFVVTI